MSFFKRALPLLILMSALTLGASMAQAATFIVTSTADSGAGSLREAITTANTQAGDDDIVFDATAFASKQTIQLTSQLPNITNNGNLSISGPTAGVVIRGGGTSAFDLIRVNSGAQAQFGGLTLTNGSAGIDNRGTATVSNSTLSGNTYGIDTFGGSATVSNSTLSGNGFGIYNDGTATVSNSTLSGNSAGIDNRGTATVSNSTLSGNTYGIDTFGGSATVSNSTLSGNNTGIYNDGTATVSSSTLSGNQYGIYNFGTATVSSSLVVGNSADNVNGAFTDGGNNITSGTAAEAGLDPAGLQDNGGPTQTIALLAGSPAIDAGNTALTTDQRGIARPQGAADDIGAFEFDPIQSGPNFVVNSTADSDDGACTNGDCTLREAITAANNVAGDDAITFSPTVFASKQTIQLGSQLPNITSNLSISGPTAGVVIRGGGTSDFVLIRVDSGVQAQFGGLTLTNGFVGIDNEGTATVSSSTLSGNDYGIFNVDSASVTVSNSLVVGNSSANVDGLGGFADGGNNITSGTAADAGLDPDGLKDNGGPTQTIALVAGSPAIDAGNTGLTTDQRGIARPQGAADDIGAFEAEFVNLAPTADDKSATTFSGTAVSIILTGSDPEDDELTYQITTGPANGTAQIAQNNAGVWRLSYRSDLGFSGVETIQFTATDTSGNVSAPATATITVTANATPVADDVSGSVKSGVLIILPLSGRDADGTVENYRLDTPPANGTASIGVRDGGFVLNYRSNNGFTGVETFTFRAIDDRKAFGAPATATITVTGNRAPRADAVRASVVSGELLIAPLTGSDPDGGTLRFKIASAPSNGQAAAGPTPSGGFRLYYRSTPGFVGEVSFSVVAIDEDGAVSAPAPVTITVTAPPSSARSSKSGGSGGSS